MKTLFPKSGLLYHDLLDCDLSLQTRFMADSPMITAVAKSAFSKCQHALVLCQINHDKALTAWLGYGYPSRFVGEVSKGGFYTSPINRDDPNPQTNPDMSGRYIYLTMY